MWLVIVFGVGLFGFIYFFTKPINSARNIDKYVNEYIDNSVEIDLYGIYEQGSVKHDYIYTGLNFKKLQRSKLSSVSNNQFTIYCSHYNKYFRIILINSSAESMQIHSTYIDDDVLVKAKVNQFQLNDPNYGTKENPIPVLYLEIPECKQSPSYYMIEKTPEEYRKSVYIYLAYLMPRDEFKKMFKRNNK